MDDGVDVAVAAERHGEHILQPQADGSAQLQPEADGHAAVIADDRAFLDLQKPVFDFGFHVQADADAEAGAHAEIDPGKEGHGADGEGLGEARLKGKRRAAVSAQLEGLVAAAVQPLHGRKGRDMHAVIAQQLGGGGGVDIAIYAGRRQQLICGGLLVKLFDRPLLILRVVGLPGRALRSEVVAPREHAHAGGQNHKRGIVAGDGERKRASADKGNIARNGKAKTARAAGEGEQRAVVEEGLVYDGFFDFEMGIEGIFLPVRCELEGNLGFRMQDAQPFFLEGEHRLVAVGRGKRLLDGLERRARRVGGVAHLQFAAAGAGKLDGKGVFEVVLFGIVKGTFLV